TSGYGSGEVLHPHLPEYIRRYRFFFNPIRYTSFGLAVCEAMMTGLPVVGMATTEMPSVFINGVNGIVHNSTNHLIVEMKRLLENRELASRIGNEGRKTARLRFNIERFTGDWDKALRQVIRQGSSARTETTSTVRG